MDKVLSWWFLVPFDFIPIGDSAVGVHHNQASIVMAKNFQICKKKVHTWLKIREISSLTDFN